MSGKVHDQQHVTSHSHQEDEGEGQGHSDRFRGQVGRVDEVPVIFDGTVGDVFQ